MWMLAHLISSYKGYFVELCHVNDMLVSNVKKTKRNAGGIVVTLQVLTTWFLGLSVGYGVIRTKTHVHLNAFLICILFLIKCFKRNKDLSTRLETTGRNTSRL